MKVDYEVFADVINGVKDHKTVEGHKEEQKESNNDKQFSRNTKEGF